MKKTVSMKLMAALMMLLTPLIIGATEHITYTVTYDGSPMLSTRTLGGVTYTTVKYGDLYNIGEVGTPSLPIDYIRFSVPCNATNFSVSATSIVNKTTELNYPVYPIQSSATQVTPPDNTTYNSGIYPSTVAWYVNEGMMAGENHVVTVAVMPLRWENSSNILHQIGSVTLTLNYDLTESPTIEPLVRHAADLREKGYAMTASIVVNPEDVRSNSASQTTPQLLSSFPSRDSMTPTYEYLIVTTPEFLKPLRRLVALRNQKGMNVKIVTLDEALDELASYPPLPDDYHPIDECYYLRQYLRLHYVFNGSSYVLLAGTDIPYQSTGYGQSDNLYSNLNNSPNGRHAYEAMYVGRLLGKDPQEFDNYTDKLLRYELNPGNGDCSYLQNALFIESPECEDYGPLNYYLFPNYTELSLYAGTGEYTGNDVIEMINDDHYGFMSAFTGAYPSVSRIYHNPLNGTSHYIWALDTVRTAAGVTDNEVDNGLNHIDNKLYPMIYLSGWGRTMPYDTVPGYSVNVNYGESFTMGKDYGGPAFFGYTTEPGMYEASLLAELIINKSRGYCTLGEAEAAAKAYLDYNYFYNVILHHGLLGDPAICMWNNQPQLYANISVSRTDNGITVSGINTGGATVAYHSNDGATGSVTTSSSSVTLNDVSPNSTIMLFEHNCIPFIAPLVLQNTTLENSQYVFASEVIAGKSVDANRTSGKVTVADGAEYEIEASGKVTLAGGFNVERGALFSVLKSTYK